VPHTSKPPYSLAEARADLARLTSDPDAFRGGDVRLAMWRMAGDTIRAAKQPGFLIIANDNTGDAA
jgi:hypothetical protein